MSTPPHSAIGDNRFRRIGLPIGTRSLAADDARGRRTSGNIASRSVAATTADARRFAEAGARASLGPMQGLSREF